MSRNGKSALLLVLMFVCQALCQSQTHKVSNEVPASESVQKSPTPSVGKAVVTNHVATPSIISPSGAAPVYREYGHSAFYYPYAHKPVIWNRDTYADAATEFGYHPAASSHAVSTSYTPSTEYGVAEGYEEEGIGGGAFGGLGGLGGLAGILGIKGIKGLGLLAILKAGLPLLALLLPGLLLLPLVFLFLPVPVITIPSNPVGRAFNGLKFGDVGAKMSQLARSVLESEQCVERMSCELSRVNRGTLLDKTLKRVFTKFEQHLPMSFQRMARAYMEQTSNCFKKYSCYLVDDNSVKKSP